MILNTLGIAYNTTVVIRIVSMIPYLIILLVSVTKLRKEYGWFTIGLFTFALGTMSAFYMQFLTIRMYNWGLLFLLFSFIYLKDILDKSDRKSWILFTVFTLLGAYTHYILLISSGIMYLSLLVHYVIDKNYKEIKSWFISAAAVAILYVPWILIFLGQFLKEEGKGSAATVKWTSVINYFSGYALKNPSFSFGMILLKIIAIFVLLYVMRWILARYLTKRDNTNSYMMIGIVTLLLTIIGTSILFTLTSRKIEIRYLVPVFSILWLSISIYFGKIDNERIFTILLLAILLLSCVNIIDTAYSLNDDINRGYEEQSILEDINNPDSIIVYTHRFSYTCYYDFLNETEGYTTKYVKDLPYEYDVTDRDLTIKDIDKLAEDNPDKHIYRIGPVKEKNRDKYDVLFNRGNYCIIKIS